MLPARRALMVRPDELTKNEPLLWSVGTGTDVWDLFCACAAGDLETVERLVGGSPSLVRAHYEYRTPLYFAVREDRMAVAKFLLDRGANPFYNGEDLIEMARIRRLPDMEALIESHRGKSSQVIGRAMINWVRRSLTQPAAGNWRPCDRSWSAAPIRMFRKRATRRTAARSMPRSTTNTSTSPGCSSNTGRTRIRKSRARPTRPASRS